METSKGPMKVLITEEEKVISRLAMLISTTAFSAMMFAAPAMAQIKVGIILALSGSAASQGIPQKQALELAIPREIGGQKVTSIIMDEASDPAIAARNAKKLVEEDKVDVIIGGSITPSSIAVAQITSTAQIPFLPNAPVRFGDSRDEWLFNVPPPPIKWIVPTVKEIKKRGVKTVGFLGFSDAWGDITLKALQSHAEDGGYKIVAEERYARADTSITGQVLRLMAARAHTASTRLTILLFRGVSVTDPFSL